jgi:DNA-binding LacI/PurR family transcriptional regulator
MLDQTPPTRRRASDLARTIRARITSGQLQPGQPLPTRVELERSLGGSSVTLQKAIAQLLDEGFVVTQNGVGTYVNDDLPHQTRIGLAFPPPVGSTTSRFYLALREAADRLSRRNPVMIRVYDHVAKDGEGLFKLIDDIERHGLAGLLGLAIPWDELLHLPAIEDGTLKCASLMAHAQPPIPNLTMGDGLREVVRAAADAGRRRLGVICSMRQHHGNAAAHWAEAAGEAGLTLDPDCCQAIAADTPQTVRSVTRLLMRLPADQRPDALVIADDHLVTPATAGLADLGVNVPDGLSVYAHVNLPHAPVASVAVTWFGFHADHLLRTGIDLIRRQLAGESVPERVKIEPRIGQELLRFAEQQDREPAAAPGASFEPSVPMSSFA